MFIIDDIILSPLKGLMWIAEKIDEMAENEVSDEGKIMDELMTLQLQFELDEIEEDEYDKREAAILDRLNAVREAKKNGQ